VSRRRRDDFGETPSLEGIPAVLLCMPDGGLCVVVAPVVSDNFSSPASACVACDAVLCDADFAALLFFLAEARRDPVL